jgi:hypothetical protein
MQKGYFAGPFYIKNPIFRVNFGCFAPKSWVLSGCENQQKVQNIEKKRLRIFANQN